MATTRPRLERRRDAWTFGLGLAAATLVGAGTTASAAAQERCFGGVAAADGDPVVGLREAVRVSPACRYGLTPDGPFVELAPGARPFVALHAEVAARTPGEDPSRPRFLYARRAAAQRRPGVADAPSRLTLRLCAHYLVDLASAFRVRAGETLRVERVTAPTTAGCDGEGLELRAVDLDAGEGGAPPLREGEGDRVLGVADGQLVLPHGRWAFYAAPPGTAWALRVGLVDSAAPTTPLRVLIAEAGSPSPDDDRAVEPIAEARWDAEGGALVWRPAGGATARSVLWAELRTALASGLAWLARRVEGGVAPLEQGARFVPGGTGFQLADAVVDAHMAKRYGAAGRGLAPSAADWKRLLEELAVCVAPSYREAAALEGTARRAGARCAPLLALVDFEGSAKRQVAAAVGGAGDADQAEAAVCLERGLVRVRAEGPTRLPPPPSAPPLCVPVAEEASLDAVPLAVVGDRLRTRGLGDPRLCLSVDGEPIEPAADAGAIVLERAGLVEVRLGAGGPDGCRARQGLSLARVGVLDPDREWHPVGLYSGGRRRDGSTWRTLDHDEPGVFAFRPSRQSLDTRLSSSALVAAAVDAAPGRRSHLPQHVPIFGGVTGRFEGTTPPTVVAVVSRDDRCPDAPAGELADDRPIDPDRLPPDATFHLFLAAHRGDDAPLHCLARASFRVRPARAFVTAAPSSYLRFELGVLGDPGAVVFLTDPQAAGVALPLLWLRLGFLPWLGLTVDAAGVLAGAFDTPALSRTGLGFSIAVELGVPEVLPRLVRVGAMAHLDGNWHPEDNPVASVFVALDLAPLIHLAGGL